MPRKSIASTLLLIGGFLAALFVVRYQMSTSPEHQDNFVKKNVISTLAQYKDHIDYSCETDADCVVKDVGNCCGHYPKCVNLGAEADRDLVRQLCAKEGLAGVCGFPSIDSCLCISGRCQGQ